jgi:hypothetical protein
MSGGGGNGQAQESANLQTSQNNQSERYGAASSSFDSAQFLSVFQQSSTYQSGPNAGVSRSFGNSVTSTSEINSSSLREEYDRLMAADRVRQNELRETNFNAFTQCNAISGNTKEA